MKLTMGAGIMVEMPFLRLLRFVPINAVQDIFNANDFILKGAGRAVEMARSRTGESNVFAKVIEDCEKEGEGHIDGMDVRIEAMNIIMAGTDTTGVTLTYLTWAVLLRPRMHPAYRQQVPEAQPLPSLFVTNEIVLEHNLDSPPSSDLVTLFEKPAYFRRNLFIWMRNSCNAGKSFRNASKWSPGSCLWRYAVSTNICIISADSLTECINRRFARANGHASWMWRKSNVLTV